MSGPLRFGSLFSGIGGLDLGLERTGMECRWQIEIDPFCRSVLELHWPGVPRYADIRTVRGSDLEPVDLIAGGFPCQDVSQAGKRTGLFDADGSPTRSGLWVEFARLVRELRPRFVLGENTPGLLTNSGAMARVVRDLAGCGYVGCNLCLQASDFGGSHLRKRVFIVAYRTDDNRGNGISRAQTGVGENGIRGRRSSIGGSALENAEYLPLAHSADSCRKPDNEREGTLRRTVAERTGPGDDEDLPTFAPGPSAPRWAAILAERPDLAPALESAVRRVADGAADRLDRTEIENAMSNRTRRLKALGNAVVPQCAEWIGRRILEVA